MTHTNPRKKYKPALNFSDGIQVKGVVTIGHHSPDCPISWHQGEDMPECTCTPETETVHNLVMLNGLYSIIEHLVDGTDTSNGFINYMEIGTGKTTPVNTQTGLTLPKFRKLIVQAYRDTTNAVFKTFYNGTQANTYATTVLTGTSTTIFTVPSGQGGNFANGQQIQVTIGGTPYERTISTVVGDTITLTSALPSIPSTNDPVEQLLCELGLFGGALATSTNGTGIMFSRTISFTARTKANGSGMTIQWNYSLT